MRVTVVRALEPQRLAAIEAIDVRAEELRALFVTTKPGQIGVYLDKEREAEACSIDPAPEPADYPYCAADAEIEGVTLHAAAATILANAAAWRAAAAAIERIRLGAKHIVRTAQTAAAIDAAVASVSPDALNQSSE